MEVINLKKKLFFKEERLEHCFISDKESSAGREKGGNKEAKESMGPSP